jgi:hypothetical protein
MTETAPESIPETEEALLAAYQAALVRAEQLLKRRGMGMNSKEFQEANDTVGKLYERLRRIQGKSL